MDELRILIAGGGTGGHLFPAIAIGESIQSIYKRNILVTVPYFTNGGSS